MRYRVLTAVIWLGVGFTLALTVGNPGGAQPLRSPLAYNGHSWRGLTAVQDFYLYQDRLAVPLYRALFLINKQIRQGASGGR